MSLSSAIAGCFQHPRFVFALVFAWKLLLFVGTVQPVPANDSYFYDGAVVNRLNGGGYFNPSIALALPISGTEVFCAYPPAYQAVLWGWLSVFGTSEVAAMALHLVFFGLYLVVLLEIFRRLKTPALWINLAGLFLFVITFQDRPDSLAQTCGVLAVLGWVRSRETPSRPLGGWWDWFTAVFVVLALCTSLQLGGVYLCWIWLLAAVAVVRGEKIVWLPLLVTVMVPVALVLLVKLGYPRLWSGFQEHAAQTPAVTGWHWPRGDELLKVLRTAPGVCGVVALGVWLWLKNRGLTLRQFASPPAMLAIGGVAAVAAVSVAALIYLSGNFVLGAGYLQPLVVGGFLTACGGQLVEPGRRQFWIAAFVALAALGGVRAVGLSTWGVACAADVSHAQAMHRVRATFDGTPSGGMVVASAAYLYEAARHKDLRAIHSDWLAPGHNLEPLVNLLLKHRPVRLVLTQFDFYRHYEGPVRQLQLQTNLVDVKINNAVKTPVPDASPILQRVVQHISWSPVIVELNWR